MIRWIFLLQGFDLQIIQRSEEQHEDRESSDEEMSQHKVATVCVPPGTLRSYEVVSPILYDGASRHLLPTIYEGKGRTT
jgi:hypothetical protein